MYIKENIQFNIREDLSIFIEGEFESIFIETFNESFTTIVGEIYRIPNTSTAKYLDRYETILCKLMNNDNVIIGTDQNIDFMHIYTYPPSAELLNTLLTHSLIPTITKPTRITHRSATLIDNIYLKMNTKITARAGILIADLSDHMPVVCITSYKNKQYKKRKALIFEQRPLNENNLARISL